MPITLDGSTGINTPDLESSGPITGTTGTFSGAVSGTTGAFSSSVTAGGLTVNGTVVRQQPAHTTKAASATLTVAELLTGVIVVTGIATLTFPTGAQLDSGITLAADTGFEFSIINTSNSQCDLVMGTGLTYFGLNIVRPANTSSGDPQGRFFVRKTGTATYTVYRLA